MLTYDMEERGGLSRYDYLSRRIKEDIRSGMLAAGEKLPSKRSLAAHLRVSLSTVESAYSQLAAEGYILAREKRGYYVCAVERGQEAKHLPPPEEEPAPEEGGWLLDMKQGGWGTLGFPYTVWARLMRQVLTQEGEALLRPSPGSGALPLRRALARYLYRFRGMSVSPGQIVVGAGADHLYGQVVQLLGREKIYGVERPGHVKIRQVYQLYGACCVDIEAGWDGIDPVQAIQSGAEVLHLSPAHQFPTGSVIPIGRRQALLRWASEWAGRYILEDDYDSEFRFTGRPIPTMQSVDTGGRVLYLNTFSRTLAPSLRISYLVLPPALAEAYRRSLGFYSCPVPVAEQLTLARFLEEGHFESHVNRMRSRYRAARRAVLSALAASPLAGRYDLRGEEDGLHFLLRLDTGLSDGELGRRGLEAGLRLAFLSDYGGREPHWLVVNDPGIDLSSFPAALERLAGLLDGGAFPSCAPVVHGVK